MTINLELLDEQTAKEAMQTVSKIVEKRRCLGVIGVGDSAEVYAVNCVKMLFVR